MATRRPDFFISFGKPDLAWANWISYTLEDNGYTTINQEQDFRPGHNVFHQMQHGTQADRTIMVMSPDYFGRHFPESELSAAYVKDPIGIRRKLVPVMVRSCSPPGLLAPIVYINLVGLSRDEARTALLDGLKLQRPIQTTEPPFPGP
jgi:hypothetical protein